MKTELRNRLGKMKYSFLKTRAKALRKLSKAKSSEEIRLLNVELGALMVLSDTIDRFIAEI